jgi:hypothetical protein
MKLSTACATLVVSSLAALVAGCHDPSGDEVVEWTALGPDARIKSLAVASTEPPTLYAVDAEGHLFRRNGGTWTQPFGTEPIGARAVLVSSSEPATVLLGTDRALLRSTDSGHSWEELDLRTSPSSGHPSHVGILGVDPRDPAILYAQSSYDPSADAPGGSSGLIKSLDRGQSWSLLARIWFHSFGLDPLQPSVLGAAYNTGRPSFIDEVAMSTDGGMTWAERRPGLTSNHRVTAVRVAPTQPSTVYAATGGGLFATTSTGSRWEQRTARLLLTLEVNPVRPTVLYAQECDPEVACRLLASVDSGREWKPMGLLDEAGMVLAVDREGETLFVGTSNGVHAGRLR